MPRVDQLFDLRYGHSLELVALEQVAAPDGVNFVSRAMRNNGVTARVVVGDGVPKGQAGELTVALSGNGVLSTFVQPEPFVTGFHVMILRPKVRMSLPERLYWAQAIWMNRFRFSYGRQANRTLGSLMLPESHPAWLSHVALPDTSPWSRAAGHTIELPPVGDWRTYKAGDLFKISSGKYIPAVQKVFGGTIQITSSARDNGRGAPLAVRPNFPGGTITVARNGSVGSAFYQPDPFFATDDVRVWEAKKGPLSAAEGLFLCPIIELEKFRYSYGRKWSVPDMRSTILRLPATTDGAPDWGLMDRYVKGLPFSSVLS